MKRIWKFLVMNTLAKALIFLTLLKHSCFAVKCKIEGKHKDEFAVDDADFCFVNFNLDNHGTVSGVKSAGYGDLPAFFGALNQMSIHQGHESQTITYFCKDDYCTNQAPPAEMLSSKCVPEEDCLYCMFMTDDPYYCGKLSNAPGFLRYLGPGDYRWESSAGNCYDQKEWKCSPPEIEIHQKEVQHTTNFMVNEIPGATSAARAMMKNVPKMINFAKATTTIRCLDMDGDVTCKGNVCYSSTNANTTTYGCLTIVDGTDPLKNLEDIKFSMVTEESVTKYQFCSTEFCTGSPDYTSKEPDLTIDNGVTAETKVIAGCVVILVLVIIGPCVALCIALKNRRSNRTKIGSTP